MKKVIISSLLMFVTFIGYAQYQSVFGKDSTQWNIVWYNLDFIAYSKFFSTQDSIVNNIVYHKVTLDDETATLLREDTTTGKVWNGYLQGCGHVDTIPKLVMDMSLEFGDTFNIAQTQFYYGNGDSLRVVDSVYYNLGAKVIRFKKTNTDYFDEPIKFIEGIGPNYSLLWNEQCTILEDKYLLCSYKDGIQSSYVNLGTNGDCDPVFTYIRDVNKDNIHISPNPASDRMTISGVNDKMVQYFIFDITGRSYSVSMVGKEIDISSLSSGMYVLQISDRSGSSTHRFIKQ